MIIKVEIPEFIDLNDKKVVKKEAAKSVKAILELLNQDAPACNICGHTTVRNGTCYMCLNCGNSMGRGNDE